VSRLRAFAAGVVDFVAGDDLLLALGIIVTIAVTYLLGRSGTGAWWLPPIAVTALVGVSIWRVVRRKSQG
jgi:hypothetical protein